MKVGDVVMHKFGQKMVVEDVRFEQVHCVWFDPDCKVQRGVFP